MKLRIDYGTTALDTTTMSYAEKGQLAAGGDPRGAREECERLLWDGATRPERTQLQRTYPSVYPLNWRTDRLFDTNKGG